MPPLEESLIVVTGLPRSGTSMLMQMLAAGGMDVLSDGLREADEDNPRGYLEFEPVKNLLKDSKWLFEATGKSHQDCRPAAGRVAAGFALPRDPLRARSRRSARFAGAHAGAPNQPLATTPERRRMLKDEYARTLGRVKAMLARRPDTQLLVIEHSNAISDPFITAEIVNEFLGGGLDVAKMAAAIDPNLYRNRKGPI